MKELQFYSVSKSFGEKSKGRKARRIIGTNSKPILSNSLWVLGDRAYKILKLTLERTNNGTFSALDIEKNFKIMLSEVDSFCQMILRVSGRKTL